MNKQKKNTECGVSIGCVLFCVKSYNFLDYINFGIWLVFKYAQKFGLQKYVKKTRIPISSYTTLHL